MTTTDTRSPESGPGGPPVDSAAPDPGVATPRLDRRIAWALLVVTAAVRVPFRAEFLVNWDAVNFALGIGEFDLATHQPHPPGYLGFVAISRLATWFTSDPNGAMTLLSVASGAVATALVYLLARRFVARPAALVAAGLFTTAPLIWYYSIVALSYMTTGAVVLALLWAGVVAIQERSTGHLVAASLLLAVVGALRPTDQVLLLPMWIAVAWVFPWRTRIRAALVMGLTSLVWVVPLVWLAGGIRAYLAQASALADLAGTRTWVFGGNLAGMGQNIGMVLAGLLLGLFGGLLAIALARAHGVRPYAGLDTSTRRVLLASVLPALAVYLLVHTGQLGYLVIVLPAFYVGVARSLPGLAAAWRERPPWEAWQPFRRVWQAGRRVGWSAAVVAGLLVINLAASFLLPRVGLRAVAAAGRSPVESTSVDQRSTSEGSAVLERTRQYDVGTNDRHWESLLDLVEEHDPDTTAVVAEATSGGSFRHLSYYAEDHSVYGVARDRDQDLGYLFRARDRDTTYSVDQFRHSSPQLVLPPSVRTLLLPDAVVADMLEAGDIAQVRERELEMGSTVLVVELTRPAMLVFDNSADAADDARIRVTAAETAFSTPIGSDATSE